MPEGHHASMVFLGEAGADPAEVAEVQAEGIYRLAWLEQGQVW